MCALCSPVHRGLYIWSLSGNEESTQQGAFLLLNDRDWKGGCLPLLLPAGRAKGLEARFDVQNHTSHIACFSFFLLFLKISAIIVAYETVARATITKREVLDGEIYEDAQQHQPLPGDLSPEQDRGHRSANGALRLRFGDLPRAGTLPGGAGTGAMLK